MVKSRKNNQATEIRFLTFLPELMQVRILINNALHIIMTYSYDFWIL